MQTLNFGKYYINKFCTQKKCLPVMYYLNIKIIIGHILKIKKNYIEINFQYMF